MPQATSRFCPECGAEHAMDARFCEQCGHPFAPANGAAAPPAAEAPTQVAPPLVPPTVPGAAAPAPAPKWPWITGAVVAVLAIAGIVVALVLLLGGDEEQASVPAGYPTQAASVLDPLGAANTTMSDRLGDLDPSDDIDDVAAARRAAAAATSTARTDLAAIVPAAADRTLAADTSQALRAERSLLTAMAAAIAKPSERTANALAAPAQTARDAWARVQETIPGAGGTLDDLDNLAAWARAKAGATAAAKPNANGASCGGFEGVSGVFARGVDCQTALRVAVNAQSGGGTEGFTCRVTGADDAAGTEQWTCSKGTATVTFSATSDAAGDVPEGTPDDVVPDDQTDVPDDVQPVEPGDMPGEGGDVAPEDLPEGDPGAVE
ncbi:zinc ribbon domain-containing protein [Svornostia abyssi]